MYVYQQSHRVGDRTRVPSVCAPRQQWSVGARLSSQCQSRFQTHRLLWRGCVSVCECICEDGGVFFNHFIKIKHFVRTPVLDLEFSFHAGEHLYFHFVSLTFSFFLFLFIWPPPPASSPSLSLYICQCMRRGEEVKQTRNKSHWKTGLDK